MSTTSRSRTRTSSKERTMKHELTRLRSLVIGLAGTDEEGAYRPEFVERMLKAAQEKPKHVFQDAESFLDQLRST